jgi:hypothetical protein
MTISLPAQNQPIQKKTDEVDPIWYERFRAIVAAINSGAIGTPSLPANATTGFAFLPIISGTPTGVPIAPPGYVAVAVSITGPNAKLWVYDAGWQSANLT